MNQCDFDYSIDRLISVFGKNNYAPERLKLFYNLVKHHNSKDFDEAISNLITNEKYAPLGEKITSAVCEVQEKRKRLAREKHESPEFKDSIFSKDDITVFFSTLNDFLNHKSNAGQEVLNQMSEFAKEKAKETLDKTKCSICTDTGFILSEDNYAFRCSCPKGGMFSSAIPLWSNEQINIT
jgi:hypothetical protein